RSRDHEAGRSARRWDQPNGPRDVIPGWNRIRSVPIVVRRLEHAAEAVAGRRPRHVEAEEVAEVAALDVDREREAAVDPEGRPVEPHLPAVEVADDGELRRGDLALHEVEAGAPGDLPVRRQRNVELSDGEDGVLLGLAARRARGRVAVGQ